MIAIRGLALAAVLAPPPSPSRPQRGDLHGADLLARLRYDAAEPALDNYLAFARQAERACPAPELDGGAAAGPRLRRSRSTACRRWAARNCQVHFERTGRRDDSSRMLAAR